MRSADDWFSEYGDSHRNATNKVLHWICVPAIVISVIGLLWALPFPQFSAEQTPWLNWGTLVMLAGLGFYFLISAALAIGMLPVLGAMLLVVLWPARQPWPLWRSCALIFVIAWIGQFIGHAIEGRRPAFFKDLKFLLIGPLWLLGFVYRRLGIGY
jgi:uncharacterized membrane protein YGL010W